MRRHRFSSVRPAGMARLGALAALPLLATATAAQQLPVGNRWGPGPTASTFGPEFQSLFWLITTLVGISFALVLVLLLIPVLRDRARPGHKASYDHGTSLHDKRFTAIVSIIVFVVLDAWVLVVAMKDLREGYYKIPPPDEPGVLQVQVLAQQWAWNFRTPGVDGQFGTADDVLSTNELTVPVDRPISLNLTSKDVIHSFSLPEMRLKRDANPGSINLAWFQATSPGDYAILCQELCGYAHYQMFGQLKVLEQGAFDEWQQEASRMALAGYDPTDSEAHWAWEWKE